MPPEGFHAITVDEQTIEQLTQVMIELNCASVSEAVAKSATIALETDEAELAQILADRLAG